MASYVNAVLLAKLYTEVARENHCDGLCFLTPEDVAEKILDCAETLEDVKPVVHAHWIHDFIDADWNCGVEIHCGWVCSNCNWYAKMESKTKYCPDCGAIMDEGADNG